MIPKENIKKLEIALVQCLYSLLRRQRAFFMKTNHFMIAGNFATSDGLD